MSGSAPRMGPGERAVRGAIVGLALPLLGVLWLLIRSYRWVVVDEGGHLSGASAPSPRIGASWHDVMFPCGAFFHRHLQAGGGRLVLMASPSRDGEIAAGLARWAGVEVVRGSASRGGLAALWGLVRAMRRQGLSSFTTPDGPKGPPRRSKTGTVVLAANTGAPIVPLGCAADRVWRFGSWDRLQLPKPFARVAVAVGEPLAVPHGLPTARVADLTADLDRRLDAATARAQAALS